MERHDFFYITANSAAEAEKIAKALVEESLAARVSIMGESKSFCHAHGKAEAKTEVAMCGQTARPNVDDIIARVKELSSTTHPCVIFFPIHNGNSEFLEWVYESTV